MTRKEWVRYVLHTPMEHVPLVYRKHKKHLKNSFLYAGVLLMALDAGAAWAFVALGEHETHLCASTGATLAGIACFFE